MPDVQANLRDTLDLLWKGGTVVALVVYVYFSVGHNNDRLTVIEGNRYTNKDAKIVEQAVVYNTGRIDECNDSRDTLRDDIERLKDLMYHLHGFNTLAPPGAGLRMDDGQ